MITLIPLGDSRYNNVRFSGGLIARKCVINTHSPTSLVAKGTGEPILALWLVSMSHA